MAKLHRDPRKLPPALMLLPFSFQHAPQRLAALLGLPELVGVLVLLEIEKFLVSLQRGLGLIEFIVANRADKPDARTGLFHLGNLLQGRKRSGIIPAKKKGRAQILPVGEILALEAHRDAELPLRRRKVPHLEEHAA